MANAGRHTQDTFRRVCTSKIDLTVITEKTIAITDTKMQKMLRAGTAACETKTNKPVQWAKYERLRAAVGNFALAYFDARRQMFDKQ